MGQNKHQDKQQKRGATSATRGTCPEVYSNTMTLHGTASDVRMLFSQVVSSDRGMGAVSYEQEERVAVTLSWINAKNYRNALSRAIELYEATNGEIRTDLSDLIVTTPAAGRA